MCGLNVSSAPILLSLLLLQIMLAVTQQHKRPPVPDQYAAAQVRGGGQKWDHGAGIALLCTPQPRLPANFMPRLVTHHPTPPCHHSFFYPATAAARRHLQWV